MNISGILFVVVGLPALVVAWAALSVHNEKERKASAPPPPTAGETCREVTIVKLWVKQDKEGAPRYYAAFAARSEGRYELEVPAADFSDMAAGNTGDLVLRDGAYIRFTQTF